MGIFVTDTGFQKKTLAEIKAEFEALFQGQFGNDIDLSAEGPFGQIIGILSKRDADIWEGAEEIYTARNPNEATGKSLDDISAETGVVRIAATPTIARNVFLYGTEGTGVAIGKQAKQDGSTLTYSLQAAVTITKTAAREIQLEPNTAFPTTGGETYTVTIDGTPYSHVAGVGESKGDVIDAVKALIDAGSWAGAATNESNTFLKLYDLDTNFNASWNASFDLELLASGGTFQADETGVNTLPANTLTVILTPVSGWDDVNNPQAGETGEDTETDDELRLRRAKQTLSGNATDEAIQAALLNEVPGVTGASVTSNRTLLTDSDGRPAKSFEAVVEGGDDDDIALEIWQTQPSGIESYGNQTVVVQDSEGNNQTIKFSRAEPIYIFVKVKRDLYDEEIYPTDGDEAIKQAIVDWALENLNPGNDVIRQRLSIPVYTVPGIEDIEITLDSSTTLPYSPTYSAINIPINARQIAEFDVSRIVVEVLTP